MGWVDGEEMRDERARGKDKEKEKKKAFRRGGERRITRMDG